MEQSPDSAPHLADASKRLARQALVICENRLELLLLEAQDEREQIFRAFWLSLGAAVFSMLAGMALTILVAAACWTWNWSPVTALAILLLLYLGAALYFYGQLARLRRDWQTFSATFGELKKDRECLEKHLN
jgi:uncharacterized membrane protein YqjE